MKTVLMRLSGPMQSWGTRSRFSHRDTEREPTKSGVIGLVCAALGRRRDESVEDLVALRMGARVDRAGTLARDYQTVLSVAKASGAAPETLPTQRFYLSDASFLVGLEGDEVLVESIDKALRAPKHPIGLGRRSYVPALPVALPPGEGVSESALEDALLNAPWLPARWHEKEFEDRDYPPEKVVLVLEDLKGESAEVRQDVPLSFGFSDRRFGRRSVLRSQRANPYAHRSLVAEEKT